MIKTNEKPKNRTENPRVDGSIPSLGTITVISGTWGSMPGPVFLPAHVFVSGHRSSNRSAARIGCKDRLP
jgi:hypothetical protein